MLDEVLANGKWTDFLKALPLNRAERFQFKTAGQIMTIKVIAAQLSSKAGADRKYSIKMVNYDDLTAVIEATKKDGCVA